MVIWKLVFLGRNNFFFGGILYHSYGFKYTIIYMFMYKMQVW